MSQVTIYSKFGVLTASPMECVDLEKSINPASKEQNQELQGDQGQPPADPLKERGVVETDECPF